MSNNVSYATDLTLQAAAGATGSGTAMSVGGMAGVMLGVTGTFSAVVTVEGTQDGSNWTALQAVNAAGGSLPGTTLSAPGLYYVPLAGVDQLRARVSSYTSGNVTVTAKAVPENSSLVVTNIALCNLTQWGSQNVVAGGVNGSVGVGGLAAVAAAAAGNPVQVGGVYNTTPGAVANGQAAALQLDSVQTLLVGAKATVANGASKPTAGSPIRVSAKTSIKGSAGTLYGLTIINTTASVRYVQLFDAATTGAVTLGTTLPDLEVFLSAGPGQTTIPLPAVGFPFASGLIYAATTTEGGATPGSAGDVLIFPVYA